MPIGRRLLIAFDLAIAVGCALAFYSAFRELFVDVPRVHVARWPLPWSTSKVTAIVMLVASAIGALAAIALPFVTRDRARAVFRVLEIAMVVSIATAYLVAIYDFLANAGRFG